MFYAAIVNGVQKIIFEKKRANGVVTVDCYETFAALNYAPVTKNDLCQCTISELIPDSQLQILHRVYVISLPSYREMGPWPSTVYCTQGPQFNPLDDGDSFLVWCHHFREGFRKNMKQLGDSTTFSIPTSKEIFNAIFIQFNLKKSTQNMGYSLLSFSPPKDRITSRDKSFISGFTGKESVTRDLVQTYVQSPDITSIHLGKGVRPILKHKVASLEKTCNNHPSVPHLRITKEKVEGKYSTYKAALSFAELELLESIVGNFKRQRNLSIRKKTTTDVAGVPETPTFKITYTPSKFKLSVRGKVLVISYIRIIDYKHKGILKNTSSKSKNNHQSENE